MEFIKNNLKNIIIVILIVLFLSACVVIYYLVNKDNKKELNTITGVVIIADKSYVIIETEEDDFLVKDIKGKYIVGDKVEFKYYNTDLDSKDTLKTIEFISDEELIKRANTHNEEINNSPSNNNSNNSTNNYNNINNNIDKNNVQTNISNKEQNNIIKNENNNSINSNINNENNSLNADTQVLNYFNELNNDFDATSIKDSIKSGFIKVVDFLFYEGEIKGYSFSELSDSAKLKVLSMALYFDTKIEKYFPGYKESISSQTNKIYTTVKEEIVSNYMELTTIICSKDEEQCVNAKNGFESIKEKFSLSWSLIKDIAGDGISNLKNWYEIWSSK